MLPTKRIVPLLGKGDTEYFKFWRMRLVHEMLLVGTVGYGFSYFIQEDLSEFQSVGSKKTRPGYECQVFLSLHS